MKSFVVGLLFASSAVYAGCGELDIQVINNSTHNCTFKNKIVYYGALPNENIPSNIPAGQTSPIIRATQDSRGTGVILAYTCDNEIVKFYSWQEYCGLLGVGLAGGQPQESTTLNLEYTAQNASYIGGRPGKVIWRIS